MKRTNVCLILLILGSAWIVPLLHAEGYSDRIAAIVNGDVILESDIRKHKQPFMRNLTNLPLGVIPPGKVPTDRDILDELIVTHLLEQAAVKKGIKVDDKGVDASIEAIRKRNGLTQEQFVLLLAGHGINYAEYRKIMKRQLILSRLIASEVLQKVPLSEEDAQKYFKKNRDNIEELYKKLVESFTPKPASGAQTGPAIPTYEQLFVGGRLRLRQITLKMPADKSRKSVAKVMEKAKQIYKEAMTGVDFAKLAKKYSQDSLASSGGNLGAMNYKDMVPAMQKLVQRMKPGDVSPPLTGPDALIMFYLVDAKGRTVKKVKIPEKVRKQLEKRWKEMQKQRQAANKEGPPKANAGPAKEVASEKGAAASPDSKTKKTLGILTPAEEKEYKKVRNKVIALVRHETIHARMKEYIEELKKNSIIEVKL